MMTNRVENCKGTIPLTLTKVSRCAQPFCLASQHGSTLALVLILFSVMIILVGAMLQLTVSDAKMNNHYIDEVKAVHTAEAGVNAYVWALNKGTLDTIPLNTDVSIGDGTYRIQQLEKSQGLHRIRVVGKEDNASVERVLDVKIEKRTFTKYSYLSNNEGDLIWWGSNDVVYGPYHTNGIFRFNGLPEFFGKVTYSNLVHYCTAGVQETYSGEIDGDGLILHDGIQKVEDITFPMNNNELKKWAEKDGYVYVGRTLIYLKGDGTMDISNVHVDGGAVKNRDLPPNGVIFIEGGTPPLKPDGTTEFEQLNDSRFNLDRANAFVSGTLSGKLTIAAMDSIFITGRNPTISDFDDAEVTNGIKYKDTKITLDEDDGTIAVSEPDEDMLGLIANNSVWLLTDGWPNYSNSKYFESRNVASPSFEVNGAIFAINHVFGNESLTTHNNTKPHMPGTIKVRGAIIMNRRAGMLHRLTSEHGTDDNGYHKDYAYDPRMAYEAPPKFLEPTNAGWEIAEWVEQ